MANADEYPGCREMCPMLKPWDGKTLYERVPRGTLAERDQLIGFVIGLLIVLTVSLVNPQQMRGGNMAIQHERFVKHAWLWCLPPVRNSPDPRPVWPPFGWPAWYIYTSQSEVLMDNGMLLTIRRQIEHRGGPDRVLVGPGGEALPPVRAEKDFGLKSAVIFIRNDGWSLGAPAALERAAYSLWADRWMARMDLTDGVWVMTRLRDGPE